MMDQYQLSQGRLEVIASIIEHECGIKLGFAERVRMQSCFNDRMHKLNVTSFQEYLKLLLSRSGVHRELERMVDTIVDSHTCFFREPVHFNFLRNIVLPQLLRSSRPWSLNVWSAGCASGEEPFTLAMLLHDLFQSHPAFTFEILATDISSDAIQRGSNAIFPFESAVDIPPPYRKYLIKKRTANRQHVEIDLQLRTKVRFERINLKVPQFFTKDRQDIIFCRNVLTHLNRQTRFEVIGNLLKNLRRGGYLFIGLSESLPLPDLPLAKMGPGIYMKS